MSNHTTQSNNSLHQSNLHLQMDERHPFKSTIAQTQNTLNESVETNINHNYVPAVNALSQFSMLSMPIIPQSQNQQFISPMPAPNKLNPNANTFNPYALTPITAQSIQSPAPVQGYDQKQQNLAVLNNLVQQSLIKLQILSSRLNQLNELNQKLQTLESLQAYQTTYQHYQMEFTTCLILNQSIASMTTSTQPTPIPIPQNQPVQPVLIVQQQQNSPQPVQPPNDPNKLEPIQEGEEEEAEYINDEPVAEIAAVNLVPQTPKMEGLDRTVGMEAEAESTDKEEQKNDVEVDGSPETGTETEPQTEKVTQPKYSIKIKNFYEKNKEGMVRDDMRYGKEYVLKKRIRCILNKITPENFDKLSQEIVSIIKVVDLYEIEQRRADGEVESVGSENENENGENDPNQQNSEEMKIKGAKFKALIKLIIGCVLDKAINDEKYSNEYARLCYSLYLKIEYDEMKKKIFRSQLVGACHSIFKKARKNKDNQRFIGIITMIGELFTYGLISWKIISSGIFDELLPPKSSMDIEVICKLLKTSGNDFDKHHYNEINETIHKLKKHSQNYDFRTKCLVKEIYEMRQNEWRQRKDIKKESPKTLKQIKKEFHNEKQNKHRQSRGNSNRFPNMANNDSYQRSTPYRPSYVRPPYNSRRGPYRNKNNGGYTSRRNSYSGNPRRNLRPTVEFVKDVTLPDRSHYPANKVLTKTWKMRNSGELSWGDNVELVYFKGDERLSLESRYPVMNAAPREEVEISATIRTPRQPGRYCTYFRLQKNGKFFGPRVWVDIIVSTNLKSESPRDGRKNSATSAEAHKRQMISCCST